MKAESNRATTYYAYISITKKNFNKVLHAFKFSPPFIQQYRPKDPEVLTSYVIPTTR